MAGAVAENRLVFLLGDVTEVIDLVVGNCVITAAGGGTRHVGEEEATGGWELDNELGATAGGILGEYICPPLL